MKCVDRFLAKHRTPHSIALVSLLYITLALDFTALSDFAGVGKLFNSKAIGDESDVDYYCAGVVWNADSNECQAPMCTTGSPYYLPADWHDVTKDLTPYQAFESSVGISLGDPSNTNNQSAAIANKLMQEMPFLFPEGSSDHIYALTYSAYPPFDELYCTRMNQLLGYYHIYNNSPQNNLSPQASTPIRYRARQRKSVRKLREWTPSFAIAIVVEQVTRLVMFTLMYSCSKSIRSSLWIQLFNRNVATAFYWIFSDTNWLHFRDEQVLPTRRTALLVQTLFDLFHSLIMTAWTGIRLGSMTYVYNLTYRPDRLLPLNYVLLAISAGMLFNGLYKVFAACCCSDDPEEEEHEGAVQPRLAAHQEPTKNVTVQPAVATKPDSEASIVKIEEMEMHPVTIHASPREE